MAIEDIINFIKRNTDSGKSKEEIKKSLLDAGWEKSTIDEALKSVGGAVGNLPEFQSRESFITKKSYKKPILISLGVIFGLVFLGGLIFFGWQMFFQKQIGPSQISPKPKIPVNFTLEAVVSDAAGISPGTAFILKSAQPFNEEEISKILKFNPEISFKAKKINQARLSFVKQNLGGQAALLISSVFAQTEGAQSSITSFEIKPDEPLKENEVYQALIVESDNVDREYSWAFQVKAVFQIIQTNPRNKGTYVPLNSGIEITFNRENLIEPQSYFEITPDTKGTFEQQGNTLIFLPKQLLPAAVYTVFIKKGLKSQGSEEALVEDYTFSFETGEREYTGQKPYFGFQNNFLEFIPGKKPTFEISYFSLDPNNLEANVYKFSDVNEFLSSYQNSQNWDLGWTRYYREAEESKFLPKENQKVLSFKLKVITGGYQNFIEIPEVLEKGYYLLDVIISGKHRQVWLQIASVSHYFSITHGKGFLWLYDFEKKTALVNSKISFYDKGVGEIVMGTANKEGLLEFSTPDTLKEENKDSVNPRFFKIEQDGYLPVLVKISDNWGYRQKAQKGDLYWDYLSTDRYTYQLSDTIRFWGVIKGRETDLRQNKVLVGLYSGYGGYCLDCYGVGSYGGDRQQPLVSQEVLISQFDTIQGELSFKGISPGYYSLMAMVGDEVISTANIEILSYAKPAYQITVTPSKNAIFAGEKVDFQIKSNFFDGTPVAGLKLKYQGYWHSNSIEGELILDENGEGSFSYTPAYYPNDYYPIDFTLTFSPKLSEEGEILGKARVLVFGPNIYIQSFQERQSNDIIYKFTTKLNQIVINNQNQSNFNQVSEYLGGPVSNWPISAKVVKITHLKIETGEYYDPIDKVVRKNYHYETKEEILEQLSGTTNEKGEWSFTKSLPKEVDSQYRIDFLGKDDKEREFKNSSYAWYFSYGDWKDFAVSLTLKGESYEKQFQIGDKIKLELEILTGEKPVNPKVLFYRYQNNISRVSIESKFGLEETFGKDFLPSVQYRAVILGPYGFEESNIVYASFRKEDNNLTIDISPEKEDYRPGEEVKINFLVRDKDKNPISSEINVAVVDEALFHILPYNWQAKILESLYRNIYTEPLTGFSKYISKAASGAEKGGCFGQGTQILMKDGSLKPIEKIMVGDEVLTFESENNFTFRPAIVQGISQHLVGEYLIVNNSLKVTPEHKIYLNNKWDYAGNIKKGDIILGADGRLKMVSSIKKKIAPNTFVYNVVVGKYHTYFAGGYFVHNAEKGGQPRTNFVDVALYQTVQTDKDGGAKVGFKAPDNITAWRTTAIAFSPETLKAGQSVKLIKTSLPFFVDVTLSKYYLRGDSPILRLRAFGTKYKQNTPAEFNVKSQLLNLDKKEISQQNTVYIPLGQLSAGEQDFIISAKQGELQDTLVKKVRVIEGYFRKAESTAYDLAENLSDIEGNKDGFTELLFMDAGRGRFYEALRRHTYAEGIRSDQIAANFFGEKLLAQYFNTPEPEELLDLNNYHTPEGGLGLFPYSDSDLELSAKMADLAPEFVFQDKLKTYFYNSLKDKKSDIHRIAKSLYGLVSLNEPVLVKINLVKENPELNFEDKIYIGLALAKIGDKENGRQIYEKDLKNQLRFQGEEAWLFQEEDVTKRVKLTGAIAILCSYLNLESDTNSLWNYISTHEPEKDLDLLEEALLIKSELAKSKDEKAKFSYKTKTKSEQVTLEKGKIYSLSLSLDELNTIKFSNIEGKINLISFYEKSKNPEELIKNPELSLTRQYLVNNNLTKSFNEGDTVLVRLDPNIAKSAIDGSYQVIDYLPSGLKPITRIYEQGLSGGTECNPIWYPTKIIENVVYFNIYKDFDKTQHCANRTLNYYARVVSKGSYNANPAIIQSLKDLDSLNLSLKDNVEIK